MRRMLFGSALVLCLLIFPISAAAAQSLPVPPNTLMLLRLQNALSTKTSRVGEQFTARVLSPGTYEGSTVRGHIANIQRSGRVTGRTEMALAFDSITVPGGATRPIRAQLDELRQSEEVKVVDSEGRIESGSRRNQAIKRTGIGAAVGGVLGGIIGGRKGVLIGILAGGGAGAGSLMIEGAQELRLDPGAELEIRTLSETRQLARAEPGTSSGVTRQAQEALNSRGYDAGPADGILGSRTRSAIQKFQKDNGLAMTGTMDQETAERLGIRR